MIKVLIDENLSEYFAEGLNQLQLPRGEDIEVTSIAKEFHKGIKDEDWIPQWGKRSGIFITQDLKIATTKHQAALLQQYNIGAFFLSPPKGSKYWDKVEIIIKHWPAIVKIINSSETPYTYFTSARKVERR